MQPDSQVVFHFHSGEKDRVTDGDWASSVLAHLEWAEQGEGEGGGGCEGC